MDCKWQGEPESNFWRFYLKGEESNRVVVLYFIPDADNLW